MTVRRLALLVALALALFLPGLAALPPTDRDESRFAQASRQMVESGDWGDIRFQDQPRYKKPIGIYWLQAAAAVTVGQGAASPIWVYRLPSLLGALLAVSLLYFLGRRWAGEEAALAAALLFASTLVLNGEARLAKTDAVLLATVVAALGTFGAAYRAAWDGRRLGAAAPLCGWAALGLGILVKGPIAPLIAALTVLALCVADRRSGRTRAFLRNLRPVAGLVVMAAVALPWFVAITARTQGAFLGSSVGGDLIPKLLGGEESHGAPPGYYLATFAVMAWPGGLAVALAAPWAWRHRGLPWVRFALAWAVPGFLLFELVPTKLPHYPMPFYPPLFLLGAAALLAPQAAPGRKERIWRTLCVGVFCLVGLVLAVAAAGLDLHLTGGLSPAAILVAAAVLLTVAAVLAALRKGARRALPVICCVGAACVYAGLAAGLLPRLDALWPARGVARVVEAQGLAGRPLFSAGYSEPSLVFLTRTDLGLGSGEAAAQALLRDRRTLVILESRQAQAFRAGLDGVAVVDYGHVRGINVSRGRTLDLAVIGIQ